MCRQVAVSLCDLQILVCLNISPCVYVLIDNVYVLVFVKMSFFIGHANISLYALFSVLCVCCVLYVFG